MANTTVAAANEVQRWENDFYLEYLRNNRFNPYMGTNENSIIQIKEDLTTQKGKSITCHLVTNLAEDDGVTGSGTLEGNEEAMDNYGHEIVVDQYRKAVLVPDFEQQKTMIDLLRAGRAVTMNWAKAHLRDKVITALGSINGVAYGSATETQKDNWLTDNSDRVLFGAELANTTAGDHSASLAALTTTDDKMTADIGRLAKRLALAADPAIRPYMTDDDEEWLVCFVGTRAMRDLRADSEVQQANREAWQRASGKGKQNPIFRGGGIIYDGIVYREVPEIPVLAGVGAGTPAADVEPFYLCGAQSVGVAYAKRPSAIRETRDYGDKRGAGVRVWYGVDKLTFVDGGGTGREIDHGMVTGYVAAAPDA